ncbi:MAG: hypothetical protein KDA36_04975, partial [Planctomycetaceae bacterium]|nr:hypothetical protein [Planctomycetaceae bacterium]
MLNTYFKRDLRSGLTSKSFSRRNRWKEELSLSSALESLETRLLLTGEVEGTFVSDLNDNGIKDPEEDGLPGWTVFVDSNENGVLDPGEISQLTNVDGDFLLTGVPAGLQTIREIPHAGWIPSTGFFDHYQVNVKDGDSVKVDFYNTIDQSGSIEGTIWNDANGDGIHAAAELGLSGWTVFLDLDANGILDPGELSATTDVDGHYAFLNVDSGPYRVVEIVEPGWEVTRGTPSARNITVFTASTTTANFNNLIPVDGSVSGSIWEDLDGNGLVSGA